MKPNPPLIALKVISIAALALGAIVWLIGTSQVNAQLGESGFDPSIPIDGSARVAVGLALLGVGLVVGLAWLVAAAIVFAIVQVLERLTPEASAAVVVDAKQRSRAAAVANGTLLDRVRAGLDEQ
jgi:hypothetical protein